MSIDWSDPRYAGGYRTPVTSKDITVSSAPPIEAAFVPVERYEERGEAFILAAKLLLEATARAEAAEARCVKLEDALRHYASDPLFGNEARAALRNLDPAAIIAAQTNPAPTSTT